MAQFARPTSDTSTGSWTTTPLWSKIDDDLAVTPSGDGTVITSNAVGNNTNTSVFEVALSAVNDPQVSTGHIIRLRCRSTGNSMTVTVVLREGSTQISTDTSTNLTTTETEVTFTLSGTEADSITDYGNLNFQVNGRGTAGGASRSLEIDSLELEVPTAAPTITTSLAAVSKRQDLLATTAFTAAGLKSFNLSATLAAIAALLGDETTSLSAVARAERLISAALAAASQTGRIITSSADATALKLLTVAAALEALGEAESGQHDISAIINAAARKALSISVSLNAAAQQTRSVAGSLEAAALRIVALTAGFDASGQIPAQEHQIEATINALASVLISVATALSASGRRAMSTSVMFDASSGKFEPTARRTIAITELARRPGVNSRAILTVPQRP